MSTFWITGARGFIGRHLAKYLAGTGHRIVGLGHGLWSPDEAAAWGVRNWHQGSVSTEILQQLFMKFGKPNGIFHLAGGSSVGAAIADPVADFNRTVGSTQALLEWLRPYGAEVPMVAVSSAAVYGSGHAGPIPENAPLAPYSPYGLNKLKMEELCRSEATTYGLSIVVPRLFSVFGPELRKQLLWDTCTKFAEHGEAELGGSGEELRDWTHVDDAVAILHRLIDSSNASAAVINVATGHAMAVAEVASILARAWCASAPPPVRFNGRVRPGDPYSLGADVSRLNELGLSCRLSPTDGIADYVYWFRSIKGSR